MLTKSDAVLLKDKPNHPRALVPVAEKVLRQYTSRTVSKEQRPVVVEIIRSLLQSRHLPVRETLSEYLHGYDDVPHDVILKLASDKDSVSLPVLEHSPVLKDKDLIVLVKATKNLARHLSIAARKRVSPLVSGALIDMKVQEVNTQLLENPGALLTSSAMDRIQRDTDHHPDVMRLLSRRFMATQGHLPLLDLHKVATLFANDLLMFQMTLSSLTDIELEELQSILKNDEGRSLKLLLDKASISSKLFPVISLGYSVLRVAYERGQHLSTHHLIHRIKTVARGKKVHYLEFFIALIEMRDA